MNKNVLIKSATTKYEQEVKIFTRLEIRKYETMRQYITLSALAKLICLKTKKIWNENEILWNRYNIEDIIQEYEKLLIENGE